MIWRSGHSRAGLAGPGWYPLCCQGLSAHIARNAAWLPRGIGREPLIYAAATVGLPSLSMYATMLSVIAAGGGVLMNLDYHWNKRPLPGALVVVHTWPAIVGFILLLVATFSSLG